MTWAQRQRTHRESPRLISHQGSRVLATAICSSSFTQFFGSLQQLRTLSVLAVVGYHMQDEMWNGFAGDLGVTVFFVMSGFLITTLLSREELHTGRVSFGQFYIRRAFRLLPLYYLTFAAYAFIILILHMGGEVEAFRGNLWFYATYQNDFAGPGPFGHTWSLAIEEKYYLLMPLILFAVPLLRRIPLWTVAGLMILLIGSQFTNQYYFASYVPLLAGSLVALAMSRAKGFWVLRRLRHPVIVVALVVVGLVLDLLWTQAPRVHTPFSLLLALAIPGIVMSDGIFRKILEFKPLVWAGTFTYAVYLFHPVVKSAIDVVIAPHQKVSALALARFALAVLGSYALAYGLHRVFERPFISFGRSITRKMAARR